VTGLEVGGIFVVSGVVGLAVGYIVGRGIQQRGMREAEAKAATIIEDARGTAAKIVKEARLEAKEEKLRMKEEFEEQMRERRRELQALEKRFRTKEENIDRKLSLLEQRDAALARRKADLDRREKRLRENEARVEALVKEQQQALERISGLSAAEARRIIIANLEDEAKREAALRIKKIIDQANEMGDRKAKEIICASIQRCASEHVAETTVSVVDLPNDEMKGRIIGREGRNIRALEIATGIDLIIDDTPEAVILSGFDSIRREIAATSLRRLVADGRIHPARIEEVVAKVRKEMEVKLKEIGEQAMFEVGINHLHEDLIRLLGRLHYRTSYAQNVLQHSKEVAFLAGMMAAEVGADVKIAKRAGLLHDLGKATDHEQEGTHARIGADLARKYHERPEVVHTIAVHHNDEPPRSLEAILVQAADALSAARPGARREILSTYVKRLEKLEELAHSFRGVEKAYAIQAGREIRIVARPEEISDADMSLLAREIAQKIERELEYPGEIKVTILRETRCVEYAK
jgi:ribonuclease Y